MVSGGIIVNPNDSRFGQVARDLLAWLRRLEARYGLPAEISSEEFQSGVIGEAAVIRYVNFTSDVRGMNICVLYQFRFENGRKSSQQVAIGDNVVPARATWTWGLDTVSQALKTLAENGTFHPELVTCKDMVGERSRWGGIEGMID